MHKLITLSTLIILGAGLSACTLKASDNSAPASATQVKVPGPDLTGTWASGCQTTNFGEYKSFNVVYTTATVSRQSTTYNDVQCTSTQSSKTENGTYHYIAANKDGSFTVEYSIPVGNGVSALPQEKILLDNSILYISDYAVGDGITKQMMVPLTKVTTAGTHR